MSSASIALLFLSILILQCTTAPAPFPEVLSDLSQIYNNITSNDPAPVNGPSPSNNGTTTPALGFAYLCTRQLSPAAGIGGAALVMTGFAYAFMGKRAYFPSLFLSGFYTIGLITFVLLDICQMKWHSFGPYADWIYLFLIAPMAVGGGFAFQKFSQVGIVCMGALNGFLFFMEHMALVIGTAFVGGFMVSVGTDLFACAGFVEIVNRCIDGTPPKTSEIVGPAWALVAVAVAIGAAAFYVQTRSSPPPPPDIVNNPAYWLFGAIPPSMPSPTWFLMPSNKPPSAPQPAAAASEWSIWSIINPFGWKW
ncbi:hypothetical protein BCR33DRAFT_715640 [Rhizoclosmatium globosum]|uniref:TM7S3/TM198-like domain-containing protein n=1 Tax=Rhizoclosmatium globosum TaxID=329046 RepID=A0A1Y2CI31_9FUNG|nr:hypothetical protein BCR33DRAFT_715640 [Rhizoclosmatium globosum]|eukprot:ORY46596.1 hypothetical protein BCR33DRAFT_715640 [Rhizoclosmatium globosum]